MDTPTKQFVKEVLTGKNQFTFSFGTDCLYAINIKRGKSRFIYGCYSCNLDSCTDVDKLTLHLLAIYTNTKRQNIQTMFSLLHLQRQAE